jgi:hypothetical protein
LNSFHDIDFIHFFDLKSVEEMLSTRIRRQQLVQVFSRGLFQKSVEGALDGAQKNHVLVVTHLPRLPSIGWSPPEPNQAGIPHRANLEKRDVHDEASVRQFSETTFVTSIGQNTMPLAL